MSSGQCRFLLACNLRLDQPLQGLVADSGRPDWDGQTVRTLQNAPFAALENVAQAAVDEDVDLVLIDGVTFGRNEPSLRVQVALRRSLGRLDELAVPVFVRNPEDAWQSAGPLPDNISFVEQFDADLIHSRVDRPETASSLGELPADVLSELLTEGLFDAIQGIGPDECGRRGVTLIEFDAEGNPHCRHVPTAVVRWESLTCQVDQDTDPDSLALQVLASAEQLTPEPSERLWLVTWTLTAPPAQLDSLGDAARWRQQLDQAWQEAFPGHPPAVHVCRIVPEEVSTDGPESDPLLAEFLDGLENEAAAIPTLAETALDGLADRPERWPQIVEGVDPQNVVAEARRLGMAWFGERPEAA